MMNMSSQEKAMKNGVRISDWGVKVKVWHSYARNRNNRNAIVREFQHHAGEEGYPEYPPDRGTIGKICGELPQLTLELVLTLPPEVQALAADLNPILKQEIKRASGQRVPATEGQTIAPKLRKHLDQLAGTANILVHHIERLLRYKDYANIEATGDILSHLIFWDKSNRTKVSEGTDPIEEIEYENQHPVDQFLAKCLYIHYEDRFGKLPVKKWEKLSTLNVTRKLVENLNLLAHGGLKICPNCPICKEIIG